MKKITECNNIKLQPIVKVTFPDGTEGYFSSLRAIYAVYTVEEIGRPIEYLWKQNIDVNHTYHTGKCSITKVNVIKLKQNCNGKNKVEQGRKEGILASYGR